MAKQAPKAPADRVALYDALLAACPGVERKGATMPYTSVNGNMFSLLTASGTLILRLPEPDRSAFLKRYKTRLPVQYDVVMKEYVEVPDRLLEDTPTLAAHLAASHAYAKSLRPKATTKRATSNQAAKPPRRGTKKS
jgi:hypothetical protein